MASPTNVEWTLNGVCPLCETTVSLVLRMRGGEMPTGGAVRMEAGCKNCGHVWELPKAETGSRRAPTAPRR